MKPYLFLFILVLKCFELSAQEISFPEISEQKSAFELVIEGIEIEKGEIRIAIFNSRQLYQEKENPLYAIVLPVEENRMVWSEEALPYGNYAIAVYHDINTNGELDTNILGIPKEAYGFSNNARGKFGPASWKDAHFKISSKTHTMSIRIK
ncbi:MAG: DUF2141 domain-containing protein [Gracilimonas sp.]|uniref:DUF2141 domain-containing protein n=1 Tax=Gracilimonas sp. TaxID=1974203 RepID=UPI0019C3F967|nr:DUF2141 domain-containing protein [Gracilimonas sp.]MBD3615542.1 DUF2141 domain-containing protein [Gracilimonas sp.]